jgi:RNA polymerase-binding transcription factor DksA
MVLKKKMALKKAALKKKAMIKKAAARKAAEKKAALKKAAAIKAAAKKAAAREAAARKAAAKKAAAEKAAAKKAAAKEVAAKKAAAKKEAAEKKAAAKKAAAEKKAAAKQAAAEKKAAAKKVAAEKAAAEKAARAAKAKAARAEPVVRPLGVLPLESRVKARRPAGDGPRVAFPDRPNPQSQTTTTSSQGAERLSEQDLKVFEDRLMAERQKILREMGHLENTVLKVNQRDSSGDLSGYSFHMADAGTDAMEREKAFLFASAEGRLLFEINDALRRLYNGEYGDCESCSQPIARARLEAIPHARQCVACKSKEERAGRGAQ